MDTFYNCWEVAPVCRWHWPIPNAPHRDLRKTCPMNFVKLPVSHRATQVPRTAKDDEHHRMFGRKSFGETIRMEAERAHTSFTKALRYITS